MAGPSRSQEASHCISNTVLSRPEAESANQALEGQNWDPRSKTCTLGVLLGLALGSLVSTGLCRSPQHRTTSLQSPSGT